MGPILTPSKRNPDTWVKFVENRVKNYGEKFVENRYIVGAKAIKIAQQT